MLTHFATEVGFSTFILAADPDPRALEIFVKDVAPEVRDRVAERRASSSTGQEE